MSMFKKIFGAIVLIGALGASSTQYGDPASADPIKVQVGQNYQTPGHATGKPDLTPMLTTPCVGATVVNCTHPEGRHPRYVRQMPGSAHMVCVIHLLRKDAHLDYCS